MDKRKIIIRTGDKGSDNFDVEMVLVRCKHYYKVSPFWDLSKEYRECREKVFDLKRQYRKLRYNKVVRLLIKLRIIKLK